MKTPVALTPAVQAAIAVMIMLGILGGSLIIAHSGFGTSPRLGGASIFVPIPQAYFLVALMYGMSILGLLALLQNKKASLLLTGIAVLGFAATAGLLIAGLAP